jgi:hypothetical protein
MDLTWQKMPHGVCYAALLHFFNDGPVVTVEQKLAANNLQP